MYDNGPDINPFQYNLRENDQPKRQLHKREITITTTINNYKHMRKLLLFLTLCLSSLGAWAYDYPGNTAPTGQDTYVWFHGDADHVIQYLDLDPAGGGLKYWYDNTNADTRAWLSNSNSRTKLVVTGTLTADDIAVMTGSDWSAFTSVDLSGATFDPTSLLSNLKLPNVEYLLLPNGYSVSDMSSLNTNMPSLKVAGSKDVLTGQTVPGWQKEVTTTTVTKYYVTGSAPQQEYTTGDQYQDGENWKGTLSTQTTKEVTLVSSEQTYNNTWAEKTYPVGDLSVTDNKVTPSEFAVKLNASSTFTFNGQTVNSWEIEQHADGNWYFQQWQAGGYGANYGGDENSIITETTTYTYQDQTNWQWVNYTGDVTEENGNYYGTITNPGSVQFDVTSSYTYSYEDCDGNTATVESSTPMDSYTFNCYETVDLTAVEVEEQKESESSVPVTLEDQTLSQLSVYCFSKDEAVNFADKLLGINSNGYVDNVDKLCMAGPSLGSGDLLNSNSNGLWRGTNYFDFTGATFAQKDITITSQDPYGATYSNGDMKNGANISETITTNEFYYFKTMAGNVLTCVLPTGNTEIPPQTFLDTSGHNGNYGGTLLEISIPNGYSKIGFEAFYLTKIKELYIPGSITEVGEGAFKQCVLLEQVEMGASNTKCTFGEESFMSDTSLKFFTMAEGVENLPYRMFNTCANLEQIRIPSTCKTIGDLAFQYCASMHSITIPEGVETMEHEVFQLSGITDVYVMATSFEKVPKIYDAGSDCNTPGTFTRKDLMGNDTAPQNRVTTHASTSSTDQADYRDYFDMTSDKARACYQEEFSGKGYLGSGNCLVYLHYPDEMKWFYDGIPGFKTGDNGATVDDVKSYDELFPTGSTYQYAYYPKNLYWSYKEGDYFSDSYMYEDRETTHGDGDENRTWPAAMDMQARAKAGGFDTPQQSVWGWRQFSLMNGVAADHQEILSREYDDTWYTMAFPWRMTDRQLFDTFNQKCEITEFKGAEVIETGEYEYSLVLHFDEIAGTYYMDKQGNEYKRERDGTYEVTLASGDKITLNKYRYTLLDASGNETSTVITRDVENSANNVLYDQIENIMVLAGHPYMIHPSIGAAPGQLATCYITGVTRLATTDEELSSLENGNAVTRTATMGDAATEFNGPLGGGAYTFKGYLGRGIEDENYDESADFGDIPTGSYFLALESASNPYPKFYRKTNTGTKRWTLYSAVITPDANALANIEGLDGHAVVGEANVAFGEWEQVEATAIEQIIADAEERGEEVREVYLNVVYNVNGQVVRTDGQIEGLPRGLYIVNGKKYMVK